MGLSVRVLLGIFMVSGGMYSALSCAAVRQASTPQTAATPPISVTYGTNAPFGDTYATQPVVGQFIFGTSSTPINLTGSALIGPNPTSFTIVSSTCVAGVVLQGTATCEVDVRFAPQSVAFLQDTIELTTTTGPFDLGINGYGFASPILVSPTSVSFGYQASGTTTSRTITLKNPNPIPVNFPYDYSPLTSLDFQTPTTTCGTIPPNGSCTYQLTFTPSTDGLEHDEWFVLTGFQDEEQQEPMYTGVQVSGYGVSQGASSVDLSKIYNVFGIGVDSAPAQNGGLDGLGNTYPRDALSSLTKFAGQSFEYGVALNADVASGGSISMPPGNYYGVTLVASAVRGNQALQTFTLKYADGTTTSFKQSLSDWHAPQNYPGESIVGSVPYRLNATGVRSNGPFYVYAYTLPADHTKQLTSITLPGNRSVVVLAANVVLAGIPVTADLTALYNVTAAGVYLQPTNGVGIDRLGDTLDNEQFYEQPVSELLLSIPAPNQLDAVANVTVPLPQGTYSSLRLLGLAVRGNQINQSLTINYKDGTHSTLVQSFSDWHTSQKFAHESVAVAMPYRLDSKGAKQSGTYNVYSYSIPIDATKSVDSVVLPHNVNVVFLTVGLEP
jgi:hypothetical protein